MIDWTETNKMMLGHVGSEVWFEVHKPTGDPPEWRVCLTDSAPEDLEVFEHDAPNRSVNSYSTKIMGWFGIEELCETAVAEYHSYASKGRG